MNLFCVALVTIGVLIITYLFLGISRFLSNYFENVVTPFVYKISKGKTVTSETYQIALNKIELLETRMETERKAKNDALLERDEFEKRLYQKPLEEKPTEKSENTYNIINSIIKESFNKEKFENTLLSISRGGGFDPSNDIIDFLLKQGFIELDRRSGGSIFYRFTSSGNDFKKQYFSQHV